MLLILLLVISLLLSSLYHFDLSVLPNPKCAFHTSFVLITVYYYVYRIASPLIPLAAIALVCFTACVCIDSSFYDITQFSLINVPLSHYITQQNTFFSYFLFFLVDQRTFRGHSNMSRSEQHQSYLGSSLMTCTLIRVQYHCYLLRRLPQNDCFFIYRNIFNLSYISSETILI